jgi:hypothetical protein
MNNFYCESTRQYHVFFIDFGSLKKFIVSYGYMRKDRVGLVVCGGWGRVVKKKPWQKDWPEPAGQF